MMSFLVGDEEGLFCDGGRGDLKGIVRGMVPRQNPGEEVDDELVALELSAEREEFGFGDYLGMCFHG